MKWETDGKFFEEYGSPSIKAADIAIDALIVKKDSSIRIDLDIKGQVTVPCDRCLEDLTVPVGTKVSAGTAKDNDDEEMESVEVEDGQIILDQVIYDSVMVSIPLVHSHPVGQCNPEVLKMLGNPKGQVAGVKAFEGLANMLDKKK